MGRLGWVPWACALVSCALDVSVLLGVYTSM